MWHSFLVLIWTWPLLKLRMAAIFRKGEDAMPMRLKIKLFFLTILRFLALPFWMILWYIDEIFYGGYRKANVDDMVWIISTPRTGSSNLTEALLMNDRDFVSPRMSECVFPFICLNRILDGIEYTFKLFGVDIIQVVGDMLAAQNKVNDDALDHHPMGLYSSGQPEHVLMMWLNISPPAQFAFPDVEYWAQTSLYDRLDPQTYDRMHQLRKICLQKVAYRRGNGRRMLFKGHCSEDLFNLQKQFPKATFIIGNRRPSEQVPSIMELANSFQMSQSGTSCFTPAWIKVRVEQVEYLWKCELDFCKKHEEGSPNKLLKVPFKKFLSAPDVVMREMFQLFGISLDDPYVQGRIEEYVKEHKQYSGQRKYKNPPLEFFGLTKEGIDGRHTEYIEYFGL